MRALFAVVVSLACGALAQPLWADEGCCHKEQSLITVEGDAEVRVVPDEFVLAVGIETRGPDLAVASRDNERAVARVVAAAKEAGAGEKQIQTGYANVEPRYDQDREKARPLTLLGYVAERSVVVTLTDPAKVTEFRAHAIAAGANHLYGLSLQTRELRKHRDEARLMAVRAAREKAVAIAGELGQKVGRAHKIEVDPAPAGRPFMQNFMQNSIAEAGDGSATDDRFAPGQIAVRATVRVEFELE